MIRNLRTLVPALLSIASVVAAIPVTADGDQALRPAWRDKVHPRVLAQVDQGPTEFLVVLDEQADLRAEAARLPSKLARGTFVTERLRSQAARSQAPLIARLEAAGAEYRSFWIANMIWVRGDTAVLESMARRAEVLRVDGNPAVPLSEPISARTEAAQAGTGIEWGIALSGADQVWAMGYTGQGIVIAGQDTGYDWDHPALLGMYRGWDGSSASHAYNWHDSVHSGGGVCGADSSEPCDDHGHGTHTMGTMAGDDGASNQVGMAPGSRWIGCRNMNVGDGTPASYSECFQWFIAPSDQNGQNPDPAAAPHVINNSWTCPPSEGCDFDTLQTIVNNTRAAGIVVVVSAGNSGSSCSSIVDPPAIYEASFSVGATDSVDQIASFSSRGPVTIDGSDRLKPDISAPGVNVRSSVPGGGYASLSGTSMAGPHVAGLVALLLSARPDLIGQVEQVESLIRSSAFGLTSGQTCGGLPGSNVPNPIYGHGRIDAPEMLLGDGDQDGSSNLEDCRPVDPTVWSAPANGSVDLRLSNAVAPNTEISWTAGSGAGGTAPKFDLLRGEKSDDFSSAVCLLSDSSGFGTDDPALPDEIYFYLVRARTPCGANGGSSTEGGQRPLPACFSIGG